MKKYFLILLFFLQLTSFADDCIPYNTVITITRQSELDSFPINYPNCTRVLGFLEITGNDIVNLNGLNSLTYIYSLKINTTNIQNLIGLENIDTLISIEVNKCQSLSSILGIENIINVKNIKIYNCNQLVDIGIVFQNIKNIEHLYVLGCNSFRNFKGFDSIVSVSIFDVNGNQNIKNFEGLEKLIWTDVFYIRNNPSLVNFKGLTNYMESYIEFYIDNNDALIDFIGLDKITYVYSMNIFDNNNIRNFNGLQSLRYLGSFYVGGNLSLYNFIGLDSIFKIDGISRINNNNNLQNFKGLHNIKKTGSIYIYENNSIEDLNGLNNIEYIYGLYINGNNNLINLLGLENLKESLNIIIERNGKLKTLHGLENLIKLNNFISFIRNNPCLATIQHLNNSLKTDGDLYIQNNPNLNCCKVVDNILQNNPNITVNISNNAPDCSSLTAIQNAPNNCVPNLNYCCYNQFVTQYDTICKGDTYILPSGKVVTTRGTYQDTFPIGNCDSFITTYLTVVESSLTQQTISLCTGDAFVLSNGQAITTNGTYNDTIWHFNNCDSIVQYQISFGNAINPNPINISICHGSTYILHNGQIVATAGNYQDTIKNGSTKGCDSIFTIQLSIQPIIQETVNATICSGTSYKLPNGNITNIAGTYYDTVKTLLACDSLVITNLSVVGLQTKTQNINLCQDQTLKINNNIYNTSGQYIDTIKSINACDTVLTTNLTINAYPIVNLGTDKTICQGDVITLNAGNASNIIWNTGSTSATIQVSTAGTYIASATNNNCTTKDTINIAVENLFFVDLGNDQGLCPEKPIELIVNHSNAQYIWQDGSTNQNYIVNDTGIYHVTVTTNCNSSSDTVNIYSTICDCEFQIPNAFTPNNDGTNDFFGVVNDCGEVSNFQLQIFNRWGELLFTSNNEKLKWNGYYKNEAQPVDDYVFILQYTQNGNAYFKKGAFALLK